MTGLPRGTKIRVPYHGTCTIRSSFKTKAGVAGYYVTDHKEVVRLVRADEAKVVTR
jgi:hypothetical protein